MSKVILTSDDVGGFKFNKDQYVIINIQNYEGYFIPVFARICGGEARDTGIVYNTEVIRHDRNPEWAWSTRHSRYEGVIDELGNDIVNSLYPESAENYSHLKKEAIAELIVESIKNKDNEAYIELNNIYNKI